MSTTCSRTRGPARLPSLVTWPTSTIGTPRRLASTTSAWAHSLTWVTEPAEEETRWSTIVWMLSITTSVGAVRSIAVTTPARVVSFAIHRSGRTADSRSARSRTCWALSSALTYNVVPGHQASSCISSVLLPMPGSPPSSVTDPATIPPSSTRSSSAIPVGCGAASRASMSWSSLSDDIATTPGGAPAIVSAASPNVSSTSVFQAPQPEHCPDHFGWAVPQSTHAWIVLVLVMPASMTRGCDSESCGLRVSGSNYDPAELRRCDIEDFEETGLRVGHHSSGDAVVIELVGELDLASAPVLDTCVDGVRPITAPLTIDVSALRFVDSSGLRALTAARRAAVEDVGGPVRLVGCGDMLRKLLAMSGLSEAFVVDD